MLPNGLTVIVSEDHRTDMVALHLAYGVGSRDEAPGEFGCAHLFEHLMFEGSANVPTNAFDEWLTAAGGDNNAWTSEDTTAYHMTFPSGALDLALFLESDRMGFLDAGLVEENVENQRGVVLQERAERFGTPNGRDWSAVALLTYPADHPYGHAVIGTIADVEGFQVDGVRSFWERHYRSRNAVLAIVGDVDADDALAKVRHWFSDVPDRGEPVPRAVAPMPSPVREAIGHLEDDVEQPTLWWIWPGVHEAHPDRPAIEVLTNLLNNGRGTRLDDALYFKSDVASSVSVMSTSADIDGQVVLEVGINDQSVPKVEKRVQKVIDGLAKRPPSDDEMLRAKRAIRGWLLDELEHPEDIASALAHCYRTTGQASCLSEEWARVDAVTAADVDRVLQAYLLDVAPSRFVNVPRGAGAVWPGSSPVELP